ncbi:MAG: AAA family ATPase [Acidobacteriota bacterium]
MRSTVLVAHSHRDRSWMERLAAQLRVLDPERTLDPWDDQRAGLDAGSMVARSLARARVVIWLWSPDFLASAFSGRDWLDGVGDGIADGLRSIVLRVRPCRVEPVAWWATADAWPTDGQALTDLADAEAESRLAALAREIVGFLAQHQPEPVSWMPAATRVHVDGLPVLAEIDRSPMIEGQDPEAAAVLDRLLACWAEPSTQTVALVGAAGCGKSSILARFVRRLEERGWCGADAVYVDAADRAGEQSADGLVRRALDFFGDPSANDGSPRFRGRRLAEKIRGHRALVILDGVDLLLSGVESTETPGWLRETSLAALVRELTIGQPGLLVLASRRFVADIEGLPGASRLDLGPLDDASAAGRLAQLGVGGTDAVRAAVARTVDGNRLAVTLLGTWLRSAGDEQLERWTMESVESHGAALPRVLDAHLASLDPSAADLLRLVGLFDRVIDGGAVAALRQPPAIAGLGTLDDDAVWTEAITTLRDRHLLNPGDPFSPGALDAPRRVREVLATQLEPATARAGHTRLATHYRPFARADSARGMRALHRTVGHGVRAGTAKDAVAFARSVLSTAARTSASADELAILAAAYGESWEHLRVDLSAEDRPWLDDRVSRRLIAAGRPVEAIPALERVLAARRRVEAWPAAADAAGRLARALSTIGKVRDALAPALTAVECAERSGSSSERSKRRCHLAKVWHDLGRRDDALDAFREVESAQARRWPLQPRLHSWRGHLFCDLLLDLATPLDGSALEPDRVDVDQSVESRCAEVVDRASNALAIADDNAWRVAAAVARLDLGRAHLGLALATDAEHWNLAADHLDAAVLALHDDGIDTVLARAFIARAMLHRLRSSFPAAETDLREALAIARRGPMRLVECDVRLERARLSLRRREHEAARRDLDAARRAVADLGYHRRDAEVATLVEALR